MADLSTTTVALTTTVPTTTTLESRTTTTPLTTTTFLNTTTALTTQTSTELINTTASSSTISTGPGDGQSVPVGAIVGGVVGVLVLLVVIAVVLIILRRKRHKRKRRKEKLNNLQVLPSVNDLNTVEIKVFKENVKNKWSKKKDPKMQKNKQVSAEPLYVNEQTGSGETDKSEPLYVKPEPRTHGIYSGPYSIEYYMGNDTINTNQDPTEVYSDPDTPDPPQTNKLDTSEEAPQPPHPDSALDTSVKSEGRDYENVPKKRTEPSKADKTPKEQNDQVEEDTDQTVYENTEIG